MATTSKSENGTKKQTDKTIKAKPGAAQGLRDLFEDELKDIYWAEKALIKALPKMIKNTTSEELATASKEHLAITEEQVRRASV